MGDAAKSVFAGGVAIAAVFGAVFVLDIVLRRLGVDLPEVESGSVGSPLPALGVEPQAPIGLRAVDGYGLRGSDPQIPSPPDMGARSPTIHGLLHATEFGSDDWSAMCKCGAIQHGLGSHAGCQAWIVVHGTFATKGFG